MDLGYLLKSSEATLVVFWLPESARVYGASCHPTNTLVLASLK